MFFNELLAGLGLMADGVGEIMQGMYLVVQAVLWGWWPVW